MAVAATTSWLDLMGDDSNISMASMTSMASVECENKSRLDPEFDHSQQGVNLLFKKNIKLLSDDSQSRKRTFDFIKKANDENANCLPPKAKQRTDDKGNYMKRKENNSEQQDFSRFLTKPTCKEIVSGNVLSAKSFNSVRNVNKNKSNELIVCGPSANRKQFRRRKRKQSMSQSPKKIKPILIEVVDNKERSEEDVDLDEDIDVKQPQQEQQKEEDESNEDDDLQTPVRTDRRRRSARNTPVLDKVVFNKELIASKVPLLTKKCMDEDSRPFMENAPVFLNADEYEKLTPTPTPIKAMNTSSKVEEVEAANTWSHKLFGHVVRANNALLANKAMLSRESSINRFELSPTPTSTLTVSTTTSTTSSVCKPSVEASEWRAKQIKLGKETQGYINFIKIYPDTDMRFRLRNNLCSTPDKNEKIGKKRWCGKYKKWRKFLHTFDDLEQEKEETEQQ